MHEDYRKHQSRELSSHTSYPRLWQTPWIHAAPADTRPGRYLAGNRNFRTNQTIRFCQYMFRACSMMTRYATFHFFVAATIGVHLVRSIPIFKMWTKVQRTCNASVPASEQAITGFGGAKAGLFHDRFWRGRSKNYIRIRARFIQYQDHGCQPRRDPNQPRQCQYRYTRSDDR